MTAPANMKSHVKEFFKSDKSMDTYNFQEIHPNLINTEEEVVLGIDEAGRGPVLGPMVYSCCFALNKDHEVIRDYECVDSKALKDSDRRRILKKIMKLTRAKVEGEETESEEEPEPPKKAAKGKKKSTKKEEEAVSEVKEETEKEEKEVEPPKPKPDLNLGFVTQILTPTFLSVNQLAPVKYNLNDISHDSATFLIRTALENNINVKHVYVDTVGPPNSYQKKLEQRFPNIAFCVQSKADDIYPSVSAASIIAKVCRDMLVEKWDHVEPHLPSNKTFDKFPSGYPSDGSTIKWLEKNFDEVFGFPQFIRFDWSTAKKRIDAKGVGLEFYDEEEWQKREKKKRSKRMFSGETKPEKQRCKFFLRNNLQRVEDPEELFSF